MVNKQLINVIKQLSKSKQTADKCKQTADVCKQTAELLIFGAKIHIYFFIQIMAIIPHPLHTLQSPSPAPLHATSPSSAWTKLQVPEDQIEARKVPMQSSQKLKLYPNWIPFHPSIPMSWLMRKKKKMMRDYRLMTKH